MCTSIAFTKYLIFTDSKFFILDQPYVIQQGVLSKCHCQIKKLDLITLVSVLTIPLPSSKLKWQKIENVCDVCVGTYDFEGISQDKKVRLNCIHV